LTLDPGIALAGLPIGLIVGLTGMGGGALLTPMLVLGFGIDPLTAVSSDLVASLCMKPVGGAVHLRHGTVRTDVVRWLMLGSIPMAFLGVLVLTSLLGGNGAAMKTLLGGALLLVLLSMVVRRMFGPRRPVEADDRAVAPRPLATLAAGALGGLVVGLTSVGSGSLIIAALMIVYPRMSMRSLVGTDLVQAVPLVGSAALAHMIFGDVHFGLTASLLLGSIPGVYLGGAFLDEGFGHGPEAGHHGAADGVGGQAARGRQRDHAARVGGDGHLRGHGDDGRPAPARPLPGRTARPRGGRPGAERAAPRPGDAGAGRRSRRGGVGARPLTRRSTGRPVDLHQTDSSRVPGK
jgi:uncharacterized membrane protein YfcA